MKMQEELGRNHADLTSLGSVVPVCLCFYLSQSWTPSRNPPTIFKTLFCFPPAMLLSYRSGKGDPPHQAPKSKIKRGGKILAQRSLKIRHCISHSFCCLQVSPKRNIEDAENILSGFLQTGSKLASTILRKNHPIFMPCMQFLFLTIFTFPIFKYNNPFKCG